jgi:short-subunit dehydrogenase
MASLRGKIVVITGASSGIGRAAAIEAARRGARLVLAARRAGELEATARCCRDAGATAKVVPTDVTRDDEMKRLVEAALEIDDRIDVWVNNAGTTLFGQLESVPLEAHWRVIDTNLFGAMRAASLLAPIFKRQQHGIVINVGSILSKIGQPFVPSYTISKFALRGLSETLRTEFADLPGVHVCTLMPYAVATPHFETTANYTGLAARPVPPVQSPEKVAQALVDLAERPRRERHVPRVAWLGLVLHACAPRLVERTLLHTLSAWHFGPERAPPTDGNLHAAEARPGRVHGSRGPRVSTLGLLGWLMRRLVRIWVQPALRIGGE